MDLWLKGRGWTSECEKCVLAVFVKIEKKEIISGKDLPVYMKK